MEKVRFYFDEERQMSVQETRDDEGKYHVAMLVDGLDEEQAKNVYEYLMRPFFNYYNHIFCKEQSQIFDK